MLKIGNHSRMQGSQLGFSVLRPRAPFVLPSLLLLFGAQRDLSMATEHRKTKWKILLLDLTTLLKLNALVQIAGFGVVAFLASQCPSLTLLRLVNHNTISQKVLLCALLTLVACCITLTIDHLMAEIAYSVGDKAKEEPERYQKASAAYTRLGGAPWVGLWDCLV